jgi:flavin reductase (DIM6/NTAB) family NADH-FMN oxidoreductase RutF
MAKVKTPINRSVMGLITPKPVVLATCTDEEGKPNIITIAAIAAASHNPPMFSIAVREDRYSYSLIDRTREFVINVPTATMAKEAAICGRLSGKDVDKFKEANLTPEPAEVVKVPLIKECPINIECKVVGSFRVGTHTIFVGQVVATHVEEGVFDGRLDLRKLPTLIWNQVEYLRPGEPIELT